ncbi:MAG: Fe-S cluster assembly protein SufB [Bifidobacteriaceae bacterium]|jgi:Fe-S cluster assembly protein SufB|nr:Fe-S cluster assembly protein SufB [Bifidobacteriaceae bacterium]
MTNNDFKSNQLGDDLALIDQATNADYKYDWVDSDIAGENAERGINESVVRMISADKNEPEWMLERRLQGLKYFNDTPMQNWGPDLINFDFDQFKYYVKPIAEQAKSWEDLPDDIRETYEKLGVPEAERSRLVSGVAAQYESEVVYNKIRADLEEEGVIFVDTDTAVQDYPDLLREYFGTVVPDDDNKLASLNLAAWSGGSFVYVPKNVHVKTPLQAYFRLNTKNMGQFERTLIIADEGSFLHYIEGCTAPIYSEDSLHSGVVEIVVKANAHVRYTTIQNWSTNVYNLVTQRAYVHEHGVMEWVDGNIGSKVTMKYPACILAGEHARGEALTLSFAKRGQLQDTGAKMVHLAPNTHSTIVAKSVSVDGGRTSYRGIVKMVSGVPRSSSNVTCDALLVDNISRTDTYPTNDINESDISMGHEASVSRISDEQLFYIMSRGVSETDALAMIIRGFIEPVAKEIPMEYALELNRLIALNMEGSVG